MTDHATTLPRASVSAAGAAGSRPRWTALAALRAWHAVVAGGLLVTIVTGDSEDYYVMHQVAGYAVLAAVVLRLAVGLAVRKGLWRLPRPSVSAAWRWLSGAGVKGRHPLFAWLAVALIVTVGGAAATGMGAHWLTALEDPHEALSEAAQAVVVAHILFLLWVFGGRRLVQEARGGLSRRADASAR